MIWLDIKKLEQKISNNLFSEKESFLYLLAHSIISCITIASGSQINNKGINTLTSIVVIFITIWGLKAAYKANMDFDGKDFVKRFVAIGWIIAIRLVLIVLGCSFAIGIIAVIVSATTNIQDLGTELSKNLFYVFFVSVFEIIYYLLIINSFRSLKSAAKQEII